jgi:hypothetical protein
VLIRLEHDIEFPFTDVSNPKKQVAMISQLKKNSIKEIAVQEDDEKDKEEDNRKFDVLVEAL